MKMHNDGELGQGAARIMAFVMGAVVTGLFVSLVTNVQNIPERECHIRAEFAKTLADSVAFSSKVEGCPDILFNKVTK